MNTTLHLSNLPFTTTEDEVREACGVFGTITALTFGTERVEGERRGFATVTYSTPEEGQFALGKLHGMRLDDQVIRAVASAAEGADSAGGAEGPRTFSSPSRRAGAFQFRRRRRH